MQQPLQEVHVPRAHKPRDPLADRPLVDNSRRVILKDPPLIQHSDPIGEGHRLDLIMGDIDHCPTIGSMKAFPETSGTYDRQAQAGRTGERSHGVVFKVLVADLQAQGVTVANERIGRYGADLYTGRKVPKLFEIKTSADPASVQQGVGQLFVYEQMLGAQYVKILVLPERPSAMLEAYLGGLGIRLLEFRRRGKRVPFQADDLRQAIA